MHQQTAPVPRGTIVGLTAATAGSSRSAALPTVIGPTKAVAAPREYARLGRRRRAVAVVSAALPRAPASRPASGTTRFALTRANARPTTLRANRRAAERVAKNEPAAANAARLAPGTPGEPGERAAPRRAARQTPLTTTREPAATASRAWKGAAANAAPIALGAAGACGAAAWARPAARQAPIRARARRAATAAWA